MELGNLLFIASGAFAYSFIAFGLWLAMQEKNDLLGFIPQGIEDRFGVHSKPYKLITCLKCLSGQVALLAGLPCVFGFGPFLYLAQVAFAIAFGYIIEKLYMKYD